MRKTNLFPDVDPDAAKPMRYRIEANIFGDGFEDCEPQTLFTNDKSAAEVTFRHFLDAGIRPVKMIDTEDSLESMWAENGIRHGC